MNYQSEGRMHVVDCVQQVFQQSLIVDKTESLWINVSNMIMWAL